DGDRFRCEPAAVLPPPVPRVTGRYRGARVTARAALGGREVVGTAGQGVWLGGERLTPVAQVCSNHATALARFQGPPLLGAFDGGPCVSDDGGATFAAVAAPARMINDLEVTPRGMYVAAGEGLFVTRDGARFERVAYVTQGGANGLAFDGRSLWVTTPGALWRVRVSGGPRDRQWWMPGGSRSLQDVAVGASGVWLASEDRGAIRKTPRGFEVYDRAAGAPSSWTLSIAVDPRGRAWAGTLRDGVFIVDRRGRIERVAGLPDAWILDVRPLGGDMFVGTQ